MIIFLKGFVIFLMFLFVNFKLFYFEELKFKIIEIYNIDLSVGYVFSIDINIVSNFKCKYFFNILGYFK